MSAFVRRLASDRRAATLVEFALGLPLLVLVIMGCLETANYALAREQVGQLALMVADNASRMGAQDVMTNRPINEGEINDLFNGADLQSSSLGIAKNGRVILSSLEINKDGGQWIHWQRCYGALNHPSSYGKQGDGTTGTSVTGMGPPNGRIAALPDSTDPTKGTPAMFAEVAYTYTPILLPSWGASSEIVETAALLVRDDRDTSQVYPAQGQVPAYCVG